MKQKPRRSEEIQSRAGQPAATPPVADLDPRLPGPLVISQHLTVPSITEVAQDRIIHVLVEQPHRRITEDEVGTTVMKTAEAPHWQWSLRGLQIGRGLPRGHSTGRSPSRVRIDPTAAIAQRAPGSGCPTKIGFELPLFADEQCMSASIGNLWFATLSGCRTRGGPFRDTAGERQGHCETRSAPFLEEAL